MALVAGITLVAGILVASGFSRKDVAVDEKVDP
jgi:hypothetical protein